MKITNDLHIQGHRGPFRFAAEQLERIRMALAGSPQVPCTPGGANPNPWRVLEIQTPQSMADKLVESVGNGWSDATHKVLAHPLTDANRPASNGETALTQAIVSKNVKLIQLLLQHSMVNQKAPRSDGLTPSEVAQKVNPGAQPEVAGTGPQHPVWIDANVPGADGRTPLTAAAFRGDASDVRFLLTQPGAKPGLFDANGRTALETAAENGCPDVVLILTTDELLAATDHLHIEHAANLAAVNKYPVMANYIRERLAVHQTSSSTTQPNATQNVTKDVAGEGTSS